MVFCSSSARGSTVLCVYDVVFAKKRLGEPLTNSIIYVNLINVLNLMHLAQVGVPLVSLYVLSSMIFVLALTLFMQYTIQGKCLVVFGLRWFLGGGWVPVTFLLILAKKRVGEPRSLVHQRAWSTKSLVYQRAWSAKSLLHRHFGVQI